MAATDDPEAARDRPLRVVLAEDAVLLREAIAQLLTSAGIDVVSQAANGPDLLRKAQAFKPDVVVVDNRMPPTYTAEGIDAAVEIRRTQPGVGVLVFSQDLDHRLVPRLLGSEPCGVGVLLKERVAEAGELIRAIERIAQGKSVIDRTLVERIAEARESEEAMARLTPRELEVLSLMAEGHSNAEIAVELVVSTSAIEQCASKIFRKLELGGDGNLRVRAVLRYMESA